MASGSTSAHDSTRRPGKRYVPTSHASDTPSSTDTTTTPARSTRVAPISPGRRVLHWCDHISVFGRTTPATSTDTGHSTSSAGTTATAGQTHRDAPRGVRSAPVSAVAVAVISPEADVVHQPYSVCVQQPVLRGPVVLTDEIG